MPACTQELSVSISFGGKFWPISSQDMIIAPEESDNTRCIGSIFDLDAGSSFTAGDGNPVWIFGDSFMVSSRPHLSERNSHVLTK
jgi:cathepsin D